MIRTITIFALLFSLIVLTSFQIIPNRPITNNITFRPAKNRRNTNLSPGLRKCQSIKCEQGYYCFYGRCKPIDYQCANINCGPGFRCSKGSCLVQKYQSQKQICKPLGFNKNRIKCDANLKNKCQTRQSTVNVCGYSNNGVSKDFANECVACADSSIKVIFEVSCGAGPTVCQEAHQCYNGICKQMFTDAVFQNSVVCNKNSDCQLKQMCAGHKCIDQRDLYNYLDSLAQIGQATVAA